MRLPARPQGLPPGRRVLHCRELDREAEPVVIAAAPRYPLAVKVVEVKEPLELVSGVPSYYHRPHRGIDQRCVSPARNDSPSLTSDTAV
jgi:hypothetical protein